MSYLPYMHAFFMALAVILILVAVVTVRRKKAGWFNLHRGAASLGVVSALVAFMAEFIFKSAMNYPHVSSPHAIGGAITLVMLIATPALGAKIASNPKYRSVHRMFGRITSAFIVLTAIAGAARFIQLLSIKS